MSYVFLTFFSEILFFWMIILSRDSRDDMILTNRAYQSDQLRRLTLIVSGGSILFPAPKNQRQPSAN